MDIEKNIAIRATFTLFTFAIIDHSLAFFARNHRIASDCKALDD